MAGMTLAERPLRYSYVASSQKEWGFIRISDINVARGQSIVDVDVYARRGICLPHSRETRREHSFTSLKLELTGIVGLPHLNIHT
jgi:hypothetical protein